MMEQSLKVVTCFFLLIVFFAQADAVFSQVTDDKVYEIADKLMCPVCSGQTVSHSNSDLANDMRRIIKQKLKEGKSEKEIIEYFTNRYGDSVLASPPKRGINLILWFLPLTGLVAGFVFLVFYLRKETKYDDTGKKQNHIDDIKDSEVLKRIERDLETD